MTKEDLRLLLFWFHGAVPRPHLLHFKHPHTLTARRCEDVPGNSICGGNGCEVSAPQPPPFGRFCLLMRTGTPAEIHILITTRASAPMLPPCVLFGLCCGPVRREKSGRASCRE